MRARFAFEKCLKLESHLLQEYSYLKSLSQQSHKVHILTLYTPTCQLIQTFTQSALSSRRIFLKSMRNEILILLQLKECNSSKDVPSVKIKIKC